MQNTVIFLTCLFRSVLRFREKKQSDSEVIISMLSRLLSERSEPVELHTYFGEVLGGELKFHRRRPFDIVVPLSRCDELEIEHTLWDVSAGTCRRNFGVFAHLKSSFICTTNAMQKHSCMGSIIDTGTNGFLGGCALLASQVSAETDDYGQGNTSVLLIDYVSLTTSSQHDPFVHGRLPGKIRLFVQHEAKAPSVAGIAPTKYNAPQVRWSASKWLARQSFSKMECIATGIQQEYFMLVSVCRMFPFMIITPCL